MSFLGDVLNIGSVATRFIPGAQALSPILAGAGGLLAGSEANKKAKKAAGAQQNNADIFQQQGMQNMGYVNQYMPDILKQMYDSSMNFDPSAIIDPKYRAYIEQNGSRYNNGAETIMNSMAERGLGRDNSGTPAALSGLRRGVEADNNSFLRNVLADTQQIQQQRLGQFANTVGGLQQQGMGQLNAANQTMGGLQGLYSSESQSFGDALAGLAGALGTIEGTKKGKRANTAGSGTLTTNKSASPMGVPTTERLLSGTYTGKVNPTSFTMGGK